MIEELEVLLTDYTKWLKDRSILRAIENKFVEVTTPYLDRHNDYIQVYIKRYNDGFLITDGGETIEDLRASGCDLDSPKRKQLLQIALNGFGVRLKKSEIIITTSRSSFPIKKHNIIQAILAVNDLFYLAMPIVTSLFIEDVIAWLDHVDIRYTPDVKFTGKSGYDHKFDFVVPASKAAPERLIRAINKPSRDIAESLAFAWVDTRGVRPPESQLYAILNDEEQVPSSSILDAVRNYDIHAVLWSQRSDVEIKLAA